jgi:Transposase IS4
MDASTLAAFSKCVECQFPMSRNYLCIGCDRSIHWFCSVDGKEEPGHGRHYWCKSCHAQKKNVAVINNSTNPGAVLIASSAKQGQIAAAAQGRRRIAVVRNVRPSTESTPNVRPSTKSTTISSGQLHGALSPRDQRALARAAASARPKSRSDFQAPAVATVAMAAATVLPAAASKGSTLGASAPQPIIPPPLIPATAGAATVLPAAASTGSTLGASAPQPIIPPPLIPATAAAATARNKKRNSTNTQSSKRAKLSVARKTASTNDPFVGQVIGFYCNSPVGQMIIQSFGRIWTDEARNSLLDKDHGHIVGTVMRLTRGKSKGTQLKSYDVAWEHTALGETAVDSTYLLDACQIGSRIERIRKDSSTRNYRGRPRGSQKRMAITDVRAALGNISDEDSFGPAPDSETDSLPNCEPDSMNDTPSDEEEDDMYWYLFGNTQQQTQPVTDDDDDVDVNVQDFATISGLHWENGTELTNKPTKLMEEKPTFLKRDYEHLFTTPVDSMFAVMPLVFWEIMACEVNRYADQYLKEKRKKYICGYLWKAVTINDMLTYFGILLYSMLYPQTGRRVRSSWDNQTVNPWTAYMGKGRYLQITSMLHFNDNSDADGLSRDSLHKIRPLLEILKKSLGRYGDLGSEYSFDEATMACFSRYGRGLISFNPKKPTGKFHFKIYMLCCAYTNLVYKIRIHTKDGADDAPSNMDGRLDDENDAMITKTEKLTMDMCRILRGMGATVNMDNYYMSPITAINLKDKGIFCRGTLRSSRKLVPKSIQFTSAETRDLPRGHCRYAVNTTHNMIAVGWLDNKAVHFITTADTTAMQTVQRRIQNEKVNVPAPEVVANYNKFMGGVDKHDKLRSTFALGKHHKFKKYYVKLMLFLFDIALTNSWIYYKLKNKEKTKKAEARADFFLSLATELVKPDVDWASRYKLSATVMDDSPNSNDNSSSDEERLLFFPQPRRMRAVAMEAVQVIFNTVNSEQCNPCSFQSFPFDISKKKRTCQICNYEMRRPKWKDVVMCTRHGIRLCTNLVTARETSLPKLYKTDGTLVTDYSWT